MPDEEKPTGGRELYPEVMNHLSPKRFGPESPRPICRAVSIRVRLTTRSVVLVLASLLWGHGQGAASYEFRGENQANASQAYLPTSASEVRVGFAAPPKAAAPWVIWFWWDGVLSREEVERELLEIAEAGFGGVEIRCVTFHGWGGPPLGSMDDETLLRIGHRRLEYLSSDFISILIETCKTAKRLGLQLSLNMGQGWPPGGPWITDEHRSKRLVASSEIVEGPSVRRFSREDLLHRVFAWKLDPTDDQDIVVDSWVDVGKEASQDGSIVGHWVVPPGKWLLGRFQVLPGGISDKGEGPEVDPASEEAVRFHLDYFFGKLDPALSRFYGETIVDIASDSWEYAEGPGRYWSDSILQRFTDVAGYDLRNRMHVLVGKGPDREKIQGDITKVARRLVKKNFFDQVRSALGERGLLHRPQPYGRGLHRDFFEAYAASGVPEVEQGIVLPEAPWVAHSLGLPIVSCEAFTFLSNRHDPIEIEGGPFGTTPVSLQRSANYLFSEGVNRLHWHSFSYSPPGIPLPGWRMYAEIHLNRNVPWWPYIRPVTQWMRRMQWVLQSGRPVADALVFPVESNPLEPPYRTEERRQPISAANAIDGVNAHTLATTAQRARSGGYSVSNVVVLEDVTDAEQVLDLLSIVSKAEALIYTRKGHVSWDGLLQGNRRRSTEDLSRLLSAVKVRHAQGLSLDQILRSCRSVQWDPPSHPLAFQHRRLSGTDWYFIANMGEAFSGQVTLPRSGQQVELWNASNGEIHPAAFGVENNQDTVIELRLDHGESTIIALSPGEWPTHVESIEAIVPPANSAAAEPEFAYSERGTLVGRFFANGVYRINLSNGVTQRVVTAVPESLSVEGPWRMQADKSAAVSDPIHGVISLDRLVSWRDIPKTRRYAGTMIYQAEFELPGVAVEPGIGWRLHLGKVYETAELFVNGQHKATLPGPPCVADVTSLISKGRNAILIRVANLLENHLSAGETYKRSSGLLGPVTLRPYLEIELADDRD